jgi:hypothetical protein
MKNDYEFGGRAEERILRESLDLLQRKSADYSKMNILADGTSGVAVRLTDKVVRLRNLLAKPEEARNFESIEDTLRDITNYGIIGQLLEMEAWGRDIESVLWIQAEETGEEAKIADILKRSRTVFFCPQSIPTYSCTREGRKKERDITERLGDLFDALLVSGDPRKDLWTVRVMERTLAEGRPVLVLTQCSDSDDAVKEGFPDAQVLDSVGDLYGFLTEGVLGEDKETEEPDGVS